MHTVIKKSTDVTSTANMTQVRLTYIHVRYKSLLIWWEDKLVQMIECLFINIFEYGNA